ncbi:MAG: hypothetical protein ACTSPI_10325 [Candidatus Heimdallarchaeaceae archaeon]
MINIADNQAVLKFGTGDICVNGGHIENTKIGTVGFKNQDIREIRSPGIVRAGVLIGTDIFDVLMEFTDIRSVDVVINALEEAKKMMKNEKKEIN